MGGHYPTKAVLHHVQNGYIAVCQIKAVYYGEIQSSFEIFALSVPPITNYHYSDTTKKRRGGDDTDKSRIMDESNERF